MAFESETTCFEAGKYSSKRNYQATFCYSVIRKDNKRNDIKLYTVLYHIKWHGKIYYNAMRLLKTKTRVWLVST